jgi:hypothetical protein
VGSGRAGEFARPPHPPMRSGLDRAVGVAGELADFAPVGQSAFCQDWQLCVKNALSLGRIITT